MVTYLQEYLINKNVTCAVSKRSDTWGFLKCYHFCSLCFSNDNLRTGDCNISRKNKNIRQETTNQLLFNQIMWLTVH